jgi:hypothetical protein
MRHVKSLPYWVVIFPSVDGPKYEFVGLAPTSLSREETQRLSLDAIRAANAEDAASQSGECAEGLSVQERIQVLLAGHGFVFPGDLCVTTACWDEVPG